MISLVKTRIFNKVFWSVYNLIFLRFKIVDNIENLKGWRRKTGRNHLTTRVFHCTDTFLSGSSSYTYLVLERIICLKGIQNSFGCLLLINQLFWTFTDSFGALKCVCLAEQDNEKQPVWPLIIPLVKFKSAFTTPQCSCPCCMQGLHILALKSVRWFPWNKHAEFSFRQGTKLQSCCLFQAVIAKAE